MEKLGCWVCDYCRKIAMYKFCGLPIEVRAKKGRLHFCSPECKAKMRPSKSWVDIRTEPVVVLTYETDFPDN